MQFVETIARSFRSRIRFDRNELSGAFGDIGTDLPLIVGMLFVSDIDSASVLCVFGGLQILTALTYGIPMPVQPLKAVAALVIAQHIAGNIIYGAGISIGAVMLLLTVTGSLDWIARLIPPVVVRGIQFGLGLQLSQVALATYIQSEGVAGYLLAGLSFIIVLSLVGNKKFPPAIPVICLGVLYALLFNGHTIVSALHVDVTLPSVRTPSLEDIGQGFLLLAIPQIPLSLGNSLLATQRIAADFFPERAVSMRTLGWTYSVMNLVAPFFGGIPVCHGSGGMAGHYTFGARTGGSVVIYGIVYIILGVFFSQGFAQFTHVFPLPILGVILLFESIALMRLAKDTMHSTADFSIVLIVGLLSFGLPYGYLAGMIVGTIMAAANVKTKRREKEL